MTASFRAIIAFGANLGDRESTIRAALKALDASSGVKLLATSPLYASDPVGYADQPEFINGAAVLDTTLSPEELLALLLAIEKRFGRVRDIPNGPRTLDLDLLFHEGEAPHRSPTLILPHPRWHERSFVTAPLHDLLASPELSGDSRWDSVREKLSGADRTSGIRRLRSDRD